jgi:mannosyltransferase OCH1-like enzyme
MIPKTIHQIWFQGENQLPDKYIPLRKTIIDKHSHWKINLWDDQKMIDYLQQHDDLIPNYSMKQVYLDFPHLHQKVDFFRYVLLYYDGGCYIDMDCKAIRSLEPILDKYPEADLIVSKLNLSSFETWFMTRKPILINNAIIIAKPTSQVLYELIKDIVQDCKCDSIFRKSKMICINYTTGPTRFTNILYPHLDQEVKVLPPEYFEPCINDECKRTENTYIVHEQHRTWFPKQLSSIFEFYIKNKRLVYVLIFQILLIFIFLIFFR